MSVTGSRRPTPRAMKRARKIVDPRIDLIADMERDPEGHFFASIGGGRRLPPWFGSDAGSRPPEEFENRLWQFLNDQCYGIDPNRFELRHNWFDRQIEFVRWMPDWEWLDNSAEVGLLSYSPLALAQWPDQLGWTPRGLFDFLWANLTSSHYDDRAEKQAARDRMQSERYVSTMASAAARGELSGEEMERFEEELNKLDDVATRDESLEAAKAMRKQVLETLDDLGM